MNRIRAKPCIKQLAFIRSMSICQRQWNYSEVVKRNRTRNFSCASFGTRSSAKDPHHNLVNCHRQMTCVDIQRQDNKQPNITHVVPHEFSLDDIQGRFNGIYTYLDFVFARSLGKMRLRAIPSLIISDEQHIVNYCFCNCQWKMRITIAR